MYNKIILLLLYFI